MKGEGEEQEREDDGQDTLDEVGDDGGAQTSGHPIEDEENRHPGDGIFHWEIRLSRRRVGASRKAFDHLPAAVQGSRHEDHGHGDPQARIERGGGRIVTGLEEVAGGQGPHAAKDGSDDPVEGCGPEP